MKKLFMLIAFISISLSAFAGNSYEIGSADNLLCSAPTGFTSAVNPFRVSVDLSWATPSGGDAPVTYDYEVSTSSTFAGTPVTSGSTTALTVNLTVLISSTTYYARIRTNCGGGNFSVYATTTFTTPVWCSAPFTLILSNVTSTTASVRWSGTSSASSIGWEYELSTTPTFTGVATGTTPKPLNLTGLMPGTAYYVRIRDVCSLNDRSPWSGEVISFTTTSCSSSIINIGTTPFSEGFESTAIGGLPPCWSSGNNSYANTYVGVQSNGLPNDPAHAGIQALELRGRNTDRVLLPPFNASGLSAVEIGLDIVERGILAPGYVYVYLEYSKDDGLTWTQFGVMRGVNQSQDYSQIWKRYFFTLPASVISSPFRIALRNASGPNANDAVLDNIQVGAVSAVSNANDDACTTIAAGVVNSFNWTRIFLDGKVVAEINANGNNFTAVDVKLRDYPAGAANVPSVNGTKLLPHIFSIKPTGTITTPVGVRLYFNDAELADYNTATGLSKAIEQLSLTKNSVAAEDCDPSNNGTTGGTVITPTAVDYGSGFYLEFTTSTFSEFAAAATSTVVAAELTRFTAKKSDAYNQIAWSTASERNVANFVVERSVDGQNNWTSIGSIKAFGTSSAERTYSFDDLVPTNIAYYRLVTNDNDGKSATSKTVSVVRPTKYLTIQSISPNPTTEGVNIDASVNKARNINVIVMDILGKIVKIETFSVSEGRNTMYFNLSNVTQGTYIFTINDGETIVTKRIVKQ